MLSFAVGSHAYRKGLPPRRSPPRLAPSPRPGWSLVGRVTAGWAIGAQHMEGRGTDRSGIRTGSSVFDHDRQTGLHDAWWLYAATEFVQWSAKVIFVLVAVKHNNESKQQDRNASLDRKQTNPYGHLFYVDRQVVLRHFQFHVIRRAASKSLWKGAAAWERHFQPDGLREEISTREAELTASLARNLSLFTIPPNFFAQRRRIVIQYLFFF